MGASETQSIFANPNTVSYPHCLPSYRQSEKYRTILLGILEGILLKEKISGVHGPSLYFSGISVTKGTLRAYYGGIPVDFPSDLDKNSGDTVVSIDGTTFTSSFTQEQRDRIIYKVNRVFGIRAKKITIAHSQG